MTLPIALCSRCTASSSRSAPRLKGDSSDSQRISSTHERPMPAITRWSRSSECRWRGRRTSSASCSTGGGGSASGPSVDTISSWDTWSAGSSFPHARCCVPNSTRRSSRPSVSRSRIRALLSRSDARLSKTRMRPPCIRWTSSARSPEKSSSSILPWRAVPVIVCPASDDSSGSNVFIVTPPGASADSTSAPSSVAPSRRDQISTSGSSGISPEPIRRRLLPQRLRQLPHRVVRLAQLAVEVDDARVEEVARVVLAPLVVVEALDPPRVLLGDLVGLRDRLGLARRARLEGLHAALGLERVDATRLRDPDLPLLRDALEHERGAGRAAVVRVSVVVDAPQRRVIALAGVLEEEPDPLLHALLVAAAHGLALVAHALVEQVRTA